MRAEDRAPRPVWPVGRGRSRRVLGEGRSTGTKGEAKMNSLPSSTGCERSLRQRLRTLSHDGVSVGSGMKAAPTATRLRAVTRKAAGARPRRWRRRLRFQSNPCGRWVAAGRGSDLERVADRELPPQPTRRQAQQMVGDRYRRTVAIGGRVRDVEALGSHFNSPWARHG